MRAIVRLCRKAIQYKMQAAISFGCTCATCRVDTTDGYIRISTDFEDEKVSVMVCHYRRNNALESENLTKAIKKDVPTWRDEAIKKMYSISDTYNLNVDDL